MASDSDPHHTTELYALAGRMLQRFCPSGSILDFGCGTNIHRQVSLYPPDATVFGKDIAIDRGLQTLVSGWLQDAHNIIEGYPFDAVTCIEVVEHIEGDMVDIIGELSRDVERGGMVFVTTPDANACDPTPEHINLVTRTVFRNAMQTHCDDVVDVFPPIGYSESMIMYGFKK